jgi:hypothetical protein
MSKESARASAEHRKAVVAAARKAEQRRRRNTRILQIGVAVVVVAAIVVVIILVTRPSGKPAATAKGQIIPAASTGTTVDQATPKRVKNTTGISGVLAWDTTGWPGDGSTHAGALEHNHVTTPVKYAVLPPVGGPHNPIWMNAGVYTKPVPTERAVHNLEHGAVWITYDPSLSAAKVQQLVDFFNKQTMIPEASDGGRSNRFVDVSPWTDNKLPSPIMISSWGYQLGVHSPTDPRLQQFVDTFRHSQTYSPEYGSPVDGIGVQTGGQPAINGSSKPNPAGTTG